MLGDLNEFAVVLVMEEGVDLFVANLGIGLLNFRINVAIGDKNVEPAIIVVIEEAATKAENLARGNRDTRRVADFVEEALAIVMPEVVGTFLEIGDVKIQVAIVVKVAERDAHGRHGLALPGERHSGQEPNLLECAIAAIVIQVGIQAIVSNKKVGPPVVVVIGGSDGEVLAFGLVEVGLCGHVGKRAVPIVVIKRVRAAAVHAGRAAGLDSADDAVAAGIRA